jgi:hypothetical protein
MKAFVRLAERWRLHRTAWPALLARSQRAIDGWKSDIESDRDTKLDADVAERISHLVAIYDGLHRLFGNSEYADSWVHQPNRAFGGQKPIDRLLTGMFTDLYDVRIYVDRALAL